MDGFTPPVHASSQLTPRDAKTADALFREYGGRLFAYFHLMLASETTAKSALADTLMAAVADTGSSGRRDLDEYAPRLFALARTECRKYQSAEAVGAGGHWASSGNPVLADVARRAVARLAPDVREAYILSNFDNNLTLPQLAEVLGTGLDAAADLRAQAGLDFVRAVALCAQEAGFIDFSGSDLRIRAEESLAADAAEAPPPLPILSGQVPAPQPSVPEQPLLAARPVPPPQPSRDLLPAQPPLPPGQTLLPPGQGLPPAGQGLPPAPTPAQPFYPAAMGYPTRSDLPKPAEFHGGPGYAPEPDYGHEQPDYHYEQPDYGHEQPDYDYEPGYGEDFGDQPESGRRGRTVLAWTGGVIAALAAAIIAGQMLLPGSDNTVTLTHSGVPAGTVSSGPSMSMPPVTPSARPSHSPTASQSPSRTASGTSGAQTSGGPVPATAPAPASTQPPAPVTHAPKPTPKPAPTTQSPKPVPSTSSPSVPAPTTTSPSTAATS